MRDAARAFESDAPFAARGINSAAEYVEHTAKKMREGNFRDLVDGATDFAKRQPAAFLGLSVLAGFAAIRFLKASGGKSSTSYSGTPVGSDGSPHTSSGFRRARSPAIAGRTRRPHNATVCHEHPKRYQNQSGRS